MTMSCGVDLDRARDVALCRSLLYQALAIGFRRPTEITRTRLLTEEAAEALAEAAAVLDDERQRPAAGTQDGLATRVRALPRSVDGRALETLLRSHLKLFGHTVRGAVPQYETEYGEDTLFLKPQEMSDIAGFLSAFGLVLDASKHERIDHVSCELELLAFLSRKEAHALETGNASMLEETRRAERSFLKDHLGRFLPSFARRVLGVDADGFYGRLARLGIDFLGIECERYDVPSGPEVLRLRLPLDDGAPLACGTPEGCGVPGPCGAPEDSAGGPTS
jgi:TorA maturation chaperone TorD